jgi:hypothetical protein
LKLKCDILVSKFAFTHATLGRSSAACGYGPSELIIGEALKSGAVRRSDVQIFTKLCCVGRGWHGTPGCQIAYELRVASYECMDALAVINRAAF